jgi:hypothetical protein
MRTPLPHEHACRRTPSAHPVTSPLLASQPAAPCRAELKLKYAALLKLAQAEQRRRGSRSPAVAGRSPAPASPSASASPATAMAGSPLGGASEMPQAGDRSRPQSARPGTAGRGAAARRSVTESLARQQMAELAAAAAATAAAAANASAAGGFAAAGAAPPGVFQAAPPAPAPLGKEAASLRSRLSAALTLDASVGSASAPGTPRHSKSLVRAILEEPLASPGLAGGEEGEGGAAQDEEEDAATLAARHAFLAWVLDPKVGAPMAGPWGAGWVLAWKKRAWPCVLQREARGLGMQHSCVDTVWHLMQ